jgi:hypothetical protein
MVIADVYLIDGCRTPFGRFRGGLSTCRPDDLAAQTISALLTRSPHIPAAAIDEIILGATNQAGEDNRNVARMAVLLAGLSLSTPAVTINRLCGSGLDAANIAATKIASGNADLIIAGGVESMSRAPFVLARANEALPRRQQLFDTAVGWRLINPAMPSEYTISLGSTAEVLAREYNIGRDEQDQFALDSHRKAAAAHQRGDFSSELVSIAAPNAKGGQRCIAADECPRPDTSITTLSQLPAAFEPDGTVTAGNSSPLSDGAAALLLASAEAARRYQLQPVARLVQQTVVGVEPHRMGIGPVPALHKACSLAGWHLDQLSILELNEAFAAQALAVLREIPVPEHVVNPRGGAIALGHPLAASGARLLVTLLDQLRDHPSGTKAAAAMCIGVGQGIATLVQRH